jgi:hypothetical protein
VTVRLRPYVTLRPGPDRSIEVAGDVVWRYPDPPDELWTALSALSRRRGCDETELADILGSVPDAGALLGALRDAGLLQEPGPPCPPPQPGGLGAYLDAAFARPVESLQALSFVVLGVGGTGCEIARHLAASGVGRIVLVDCDVVEPANLNRQFLYLPGDVGSPKASVAARRLAEQYPSTAVEVRHARVDGPQDLDALGLPESTALVCCADQPIGQIGQWCAEHARRRGWAFAIAGVGVRGGHWGPVLLPQRPARALPPCWTGEAMGVSPSFGPTNSLVAAALAHDLLHAVVDGDAPSVDHWIFVDFRTFSVHRVPLCAA